MRGETIAFVMQNTLNPENKQVILNFLAFLEGQGYSEDYQRSYALVLAALDKHLEGRDFRKAREQDILAFLSNRKPHTRATYATRIKAFYRWLLNGCWRKGPYPKVVENLSTTIRKKELPVKSPNDILTKEEVLKLIDYADNPRDKCLIAMLYDTGARPGEIINLRIKDVKLNNSHGEIYVNGKTGMRRIPLVFSIPYLTKWLNSHPEKSNPEAKLFVKVKTGRGSEEFTEAGLIGLVKRLAKKARINKRMYPYIFRHSRLTELANILREHQLKAFAGWTAGSKMAEHYVRLAGLDIDSSILEYYGLPSKKEEREQTLKPKICPRCQSLNEPNVIACDKCGMLLDERYALSTIGIQQELRKEIESLREFMTQYTKVIVETLIFRDPETAREYLKRNPSLLREYISIEFDELYDRLSKKQGKPKEKLIEEKVNDILSSDEAYTKFVKGIILRYEDPL